MSVTGSLAHSLTDHSVDLAGASGGGYALIGAHLAAVVTVSIADSGYLDRDRTRVDGRSTGGGSSITLIFTVHSPPCMAIRVSQINWNFIEFFFQNWKEMNYKCWDGRFCRMLLSAPVRLSVVLTTGEIF